MCLSVPVLPLAASLLLLGMPTRGSAQSEPLSFNHDVRPILSENCFHCHGQDAAQREADLRLDTRDGALDDLGGYSALVPGNPEDSELYLRITSPYEDEQMPPPDSNRSLTDAERAILRQWIAEGAEYDTHWAFVPPRKTELPNRNANPIDAFVGETLSERSLEFAPPADPAIWLRRASFDLTGLPPTLEAIDAFETAVKTKGETAYENAVDQLLASPQFGEKLASEWMDAARYADTHGFNNDSTRSMWRWRDWVIDAFNQNMPYDQFITEQLAGDLLPNPTLEQRIATGFNRNHGINSEGGIIEEEYRVEYVADRVRTVGMVWMGLTTECARCHDHKYDPFTQEDYYRLFAFFNNVTEFGEDGRVANAVPMIPSPTTAQASELASLERSLQETARLRNRQLANASFALTRQGLAQLQARIHETTLPEPVWKVDSPDSAPLETKSQTTPATGIKGHALASTPDQPIGNIAPKTTAFQDETDAFSIAFWTRPDPESPANAPLVSNAKFDWEPSSSSYGKGWDIRIVDGEVQFAMAKRYPAYSVLVRTRFARVRPNEWIHIAVTFDGKNESDNAYTPASRFHIYIDGAVARLDVIHDGLQDVAKEPDLPTFLGSDLHPDSEQFIGLIDEIQQFDRTLSPQQIAGLYQRDLVDFAVASDESDRMDSRIRRGLATALLDRAAQPEWNALVQRYRDTRQALVDLERALPTTMVMQERDGMRDTFVLNRGNYDAHGKRVEPGVPEDWLAPWPEGAPRNRLGLAQWLTQPGQPLTARVVVNQFWQQFFGVGLVKTSEDFGVQSEFPSHPELLDWLAVDFRESGWNVKRLYKQIALSRTYRQQSNLPGSLLATDPENRLLARGPRIRLPAEAIRDQALALSGLLNSDIGGPSVRPYQPEGFYNNTVVGANYPSTKWIQSEGDALYRRSLYTFWKRTVPHPLMTTFDTPSREVCTVRRPTTNTPLQALALMNEPTFVEASRALAERLLSDADATTDERLQRAFRMATGRQPTVSESEVLVQAFDQMKTSFRANPNDADEFLQFGEHPAADEYSPVDMAAYTAVMNLILNLDETLTKG